MKKVLKKKQFVRKILPKKMTMSFVMSVWRWYYVDK